MNKMFKKDLSRYGISNNVFIRYAFGLKHPEVRFLKCFRNAQSSKIFLFKLFFQVKLMILSNKTHIQIPSSTSIGEGFYIGHLGRIIINGSSKLGKNINIATGVVIGQENRGIRKGCPTVGNDVWIGANSIVVGNISIGNDVLIAPLSFVNFDVPDHSIVIGNPAKIIHRDNATKNYINNRL